MKVQMQGRIRRGEDGSHGLLVLGRGYTTEHGWPSGTCPVALALWFLLQVCGVRCRWYDILGGMAFLLQRSEVNLSYVSGIWFHVILTILWVWYYCSHFTDEIVHADSVSSCHIEHSPQPFWHQPGTNIMEDNCSPDLVCLCVCVWGGGLGMISAHYIYSDFISNLMLPLIWQEVWAHGPEVGEPDIEDRSRMWV